MNNIEIILSKYIKKNSCVVDVMAISLMVILIFTVCRNLFITGEPLRPFDDVYYLDFPYRVLAWESVMKGEWPFWNPYNSGGVNLMGQPFCFLIYPFYDLVYFVPKEKIFLILYLIQILHWIMASAGMYLLLKKICRNPLISLWGSISYSLSYPLVSAFTIGQLLVAYAYLPWIILIFLSSGKRSDYLTILLLSLSFFLLAGGGFPQWTFFVLLVVILVLLFSYNPFYFEERKKSIKWIGILLISGFVAFILGCIEFIPFLEQNLSGARSNIDLTTINTQQDWSFPWQLSFRLFIPNLFSSNLRNFIHDPMIFLEDNFNSYFGIVAAVLSISGLLITHKKWMYKWKLTFIMVFLMALGIPWVTSMLSFVTLKSDLVYTRIGSFIHFTGIILAAIMLRQSLLCRRKMLLVINVLSAGLILLLLLLGVFHFFGRIIWGPELNVSHIMEQIMVGIVFIGIYLVSFFLYDKRILHRNCLLILLCMVAVGELYYLSVNKIKPHLEAARTQQYFQNTESERILDTLLREDKAIYRVHNASVRLADLTHERGKPYFHYFPNGNIYRHFYEANGYILNMQKDVGRIVTGRRNRYFVRMGDLLINGSIPNLLSIKYVIAPSDLDLYNPIPPGARLDPAKQIRIVKQFSDGPEDKPYNLKIVEIENVPPRFFFTKRLKDGLDREAIFDRIINPVFDPREITYFEDVLMKKKKSDFQETVFDTAKQKILGVQIPNANQIVLKIYAEEPGILVTNNYWHKWWRVRVNEESQRLYRVNYNFQAVEIPAGNSTVHFYCMPKSFEIGKYLSVLGILALVFLLLRVLKDSRPQESGQ